jgi:hypothetical protein
VVWWCVDVLMCWRVGALVCWCVGVLVCWCVDGVCRSVPLMTPCLSPLYSIAVERDLEARNGKTQCISMARVCRAPFRQPQHKASRLRQATNTGGRNLTEPKPPRDPFQTKLRAPVSKLCEMFVNNQGNQAESREERGENREGRRKKQGREE